ncbi:hypothetical protein ACJX0J_037837, partial [Zea mays]
GYCTSACVLVHELIIWYKIWFIANSPWLLLLLLTAWLIVREIFVNLAVALV